MGPQMYIYLIVGALIVLSAAAWFSSYTLRARHKREEDLRQLEEGENPAASEPPDDKPPMIYG
jgi:hypothetical protein